jgi:hypothetical protein
MNALIALALVWSGCSVALVVTVSAGQPAYPVHGDADCNNGVNSIDAVLILQQDAGLFTSDCPDNADTNEDATVNSLDAALVLQFEAALLKQLGPLHIEIGNDSASPGETASVTLHAVVQPPGLTAWEIELTYNASVLTLETCTPGDASTCDTSQGPGTVMITGSSAEPVIGELMIADFAFTCGDGLSILTLDVLGLEQDPGHHGSAASGDPTFAVHNNNIMCME